MHLNTKNRWFERGTHSTPTRSVAISTTFCPTGRGRLALAFGGCLWKRHRRRTLGRPHGGRQASERKTSLLREEIDKASMFEEIVGTSPRFEKCSLSRISKVAPTDSTVLITGETGTGKELVARAIHRRSDRASRAFISVNCAAYPNATLIALGAIWP